MLGVDALAGVEPGTVQGGGDIEEDAAGDDAVLEGGDGVMRGAEAGGDQLGGLAVVHLPVPEEVAEAVDVGDGVAVEDEADELEGAGVAGARRAHAVLVVEALAGGEHVALGRSEGMVGLGAGLDLPGAGDADALPHEGGGGAALLGGDQVEGPELVVVAPATPVGERVEVIEDLVFGGRSGHGGASRGWMRGRMGGAGGRVKGRGSSARADSRSPSR